MRFVNALSVVLRRCRRGHRQRHQQRVLTTVSLESFQTALYACRLRFTLLSEAPSPPSAPVTETVLSTCWLLSIVLLNFCYSVYTIYNVHGKCTLITCDTDVTSWTTIFFLHLIVIIIVIGGKFRNVKRGLVQYNRNTLTLGLAHSLHLMIIFFSFRYFFYFHGNH